MYTLMTEAEFDSAHFLKGYPGKCANLHGHRWRVVCEIAASDLQKEGDERGMVLDFGVLKKALKSLTESFDHKLILEKNTLRSTTVKALEEEGFQFIEVDFIPTAECMAKFFYDALDAQGFPIHKITVYETPNNAAGYQR